MKAKLLCAAMLNSLPIANPADPGRRYTVRCRLALGHDGSHHEWAGSSGMRWNDDGQILEQRGQYQHIPEWNFTEAPG